MENNRTTAARFTKSIIEFRTPDEPTRVEGLIISIHLPLVLADGYVVLALIKSLELRDVYLIHSFIDCVGSNTRTYAAIKADDFAKRPPSVPFEMIYKLEVLELEVALP